MKTIQLTHCGMDGSEPTVKEARQDAARKIEATLRADYTPRVLRWKGIIALIWRTPHGVTSTYLRGTEDGPLNFRGECLHGRDSLHDAELSCRYGLAQQTADIETDEMSEIIAGYPKLESEYRSWRGFQRAYHYAPDAIVAQGGTVRHQWALDHGHQYNVLSEPLPLAA